MAPFDFVRTFISICMNCNATKKYLLKFFFFYGNIMKCVL